MSLIQKPVPDSANRRRSYRKNTRCLMFEILKVFEILNAIHHDCVYSFICFDGFLIYLTLIHLQFFFNHLYLIVSAMLAKTNLLPLPVIENFMDKPS